MNLIPVAKGGEYLEVHPTTLAAHRQLGWRECEKREPPAESPVNTTDSNGDGKLTAAELKAELTAKGIAFKGNTSKAELQALLEAAEKPAGE